MSISNLVLAYEIFPTNSNVNYLIVFRAECYGTRTGVRSERWYAFPSVDYLLKIMSASNWTWKKRFITINFSISYASDMTFLARSLRLTVSCQQRWYRLNMYICIVFGRMTFANKQARLHRGKAENRKMAVRLNVFICLSRLFSFTAGIYRNQHWYSTHVDLFSWRSPRRKSQSVMSDCRCQTQHKQPVLLQSHAEISPPQNENISLSLDQSLMYWLAHVCELARYAFDVHVNTEQPRCTLHNTFRRKKGAPPYSTRQQLTRRDAQLKQPNINVIKISLFPVNISSVLVSLFVLFDAIQSLHAHVNWLIALNVISLLFLLVVLLSLLFFCCSPLDCLMPVSGLFSAICHTFS